MDFGKETLKVSNGDVSSSTIGETGDWHVQRTESFDK